MLQKRMQRIRALDRKYEGFSLQRNFGIQLLMRKVMYGEKSDN